MRDRDERLFEAKRAGMVARIRDSGLRQERAEALFDAFDAEAVARGVPRGSQPYWDEAERWIADAARR